MGMKKRVLKWNVKVDGQEHPIGAGTVVLVACQDDAGVVQVWTEEAVDLPRPELRAARVYGTGQDLPFSDVHLGSVLAMGGRLVWHVYGSHNTYPVSEDKA